jgi:hypothetical protein
MNTSFGQALEKYLNTISQKKAINTHLLEKNAARRLLKQIGAATAAYCLHFAQPYS